MSEQVAEQVAEPVQPSVMETPAEVAQGGSGNSFMEMIPEELREHPSLSPIKDVGNLARSYVNAQRLIGSDKIPLPKNPTDEDLDNIYSKLGRPETPEGYELPVDGNVITEEVTTTYTTAQLSTINYAQSADVLYLAQESHAPAKLTRASDTSWTLTDIDFKDGPWLDENITSTTLYASADTGSVTLTASASLFTSSDVGRLVRFREILEIHHDEWAASTSYADGVTVRYNGHVYEQVTGSTQTSGNTPPVHLEGTETYGALDWEYKHDGTGYLEITAFTSATVVTATVKNDTGVLPDHVVAVIAVVASVTKPPSLNIRI
jgi:hypothetical protein